MGPSARTASIEVARDSLHSLYLSRLLAFGVILWGSSTRTARRRRDMNARRPTRQVRRPARARPDPSDGIPSRPPAGVADFVTTPVPPESRSGRKPEDRYCRRRHCRRRGARAPRHGPRAGFPGQRPRSQDASPKGDPSRQMACQARCRGAIAGTLQESDGTKTLALSSMAAYCPL